MGTWQRVIMAATDCAVVVPVGNVVRTSVVTPSRNDFASARRAAKLLAMKSQVAALYAWSCPRCGRVQDRPDPTPCCARPRSMLSVCPPQRRHLVRHPAPAPGGQTPRWVSDAQPAPAALPMVSPGDLAQLAARRLWERLESGAVCVTPRDAATLIRLAHETERDRAAPDRAGQPLSASCSGRPNGTSAPMAGSGSPPTCAPMRCCWACGRGPAGPDKGRRPGAPWPACRMYRPTFRRRPRPGP